MCLALASCVQAGASKFRSKVWKLQSDRTDNIPIFESIMTCGSRLLLWATYEFNLLPLSSIQWQKNKSVLAHLQESNTGSFNRESSLLLLDAVLTLHYPKYVLVFHNLFGAANFNLFLAFGIWSIWNSQFFCYLCGIVIAGLCSIGQAVVFLIKNILML